MLSDEIKSIADDHWEWVESLLKSIDPILPINLEMVEYLYKTAFLHGWKHGIDSHKQTTQIKTDGLYRTLEP
jgi:hypothetical protein